MRRPPHSEPSPRSEKSKKLRMVSWTSPRAHLSAVAVAVCALASAQRFVHALKLSYTGGRTGPARGEFEPRSVELLHGERRDVFRHDLVVGVLVRDVVDGGGVGGVRVVGVRDVRDSATEDYPASKRQNAWAGVSEAGALRVLVPDKLAKTLASMNTGIRIDNGPLIN